MHVHSDIYTDTIIIQIHLRNGSKGLIKYDYINQLQECSALFHKTICRN